MTESIVRYKVETATLQEGYIMRWKRTHKVLVIAADKETRKGLVNHYLKSLKHQYAHNAFSVIRRANSTSNAFGKILDPDMVIFPEGFSDAEQQQLKELLSRFVSNVIFITVSIKDGRCVNESCSRKRK